MTVDTARSAERPPRALITGANGQDGHYLTVLLLSMDYEVHHLVRQTAPEIVPGVRTHIGDILDTERVKAVLDAARPDEVYNLAGFSSVGRSWSHAPEVMEINAVSVVRMLDQVRILEEHIGRQVRFYQASSSEMFGAPEEVPQTEGTALRPTSPYGVSKAAAHLTAINYRESYGMYCCSGILYNHESPRRPPGFVTRKISQGVARIALGESSHITLGNLDVERDWGYAPDYVRAMWLMLQQPTAADYIVATGVSRSLRDFLDAAFASVGIDDWKSYVQSDPSLMRPQEVRGLVGNARLAAKRLGWAPTKPFADVVREMVKFDLMELDTPG